jgi:hypothetical protein
MKVDDNAENQELAKRAFNVQQSFYSPAEAITAELARLSNSEASYEELRETLTTVLKLVQESANNMHK